MTPRRWQVLGGVAAGLTNAEIAAKLFLSENTVKTHVWMLLRMFHVTNRIRLVALAYEEGWLPVRGEEDDWIIPGELMQVISDVFTALREGRTSQARTLAERHDQLLPRTVGLPTGRSRKWAQP